MLITKWQRARITAVMALVFVAEHADMMILSAMYLPISRTLHIGVAKLGTLSMYRGIVSAVVVPFVGVLGNMVNRIRLIALGALIWSAMSIAFGLSQTYTEAAAWAALNGVGLALVMPCVQAILAEVYYARQRGRAFGLLFTISALGGMLFNFVAVTFGDRSINGLPGWRVIFYIVGTFAFVSGILVVLGGIEPRNLERKSDEGKEAHESATSGFWKGILTILNSVQRVFRIRSFQVILLVGIIETFHWASGGYQVMWLQLLGFSDWATGTLTVCTTLGAALGFLTGGWLSDCLAFRFPNAARPFINQLSAAMTLPLTIVLYKAAPGCSRYATGVPGSLNHLLGIYGVLSFSIGLLGTWSASNNAAMFAEIVPRSIRTSVYAFDKCIIGAFGALSSPLAGVMAEKLFGYSGGQHHAAVSSAPTAAAHAPGVHGAPVPTAHEVAATQAAARARQNVQNAHSLENGLLVVTVAPTVIRFFLYTILYWTLPKDRVIEPDEEEDELLASGGAPFSGTKGATDKKNSGEHDVELGRRMSADGSTRGGPRTPRAPGPGAIASALERRRSTTGGSMELGTRRQSLGRDMSRHKSLALESLGSQELFGWNSRDAPAAAEAGSAGDLHSAPSTGGASAAPERRASLSAALQTAASLKKSPRTPRGAKLQED